MYAAASGSFEAVNLLLQYSQNAFAHRNYLGYSVLDFAVNLDLKLELSNYMR